MKQTKEQEFIEQILDRDEQGLAIFDLRDIMKDITDKKLRKKLANFIMKSLLPNMLIPIQWFFKERRELRARLFMKDGVPFCPVCKEPYINAIDPITKKISKYEWEGTCEHFPKNLRLSIG